MTHANTVHRVNRVADSIFTVSMVPVSELVSFVNTTHAHVLGAVCYAHGRPLGTKVKLPSVDIELPQLQSDTFVEVWQSPEVTQHGVAGFIQYGKSAKLLFACVELECDADLQQQTETVYQEILAFVNQAGYPHLLRMWNHFPLINDYEHAVERYQLFCIGRFNAFKKHFGDNFQQQLPAASAIGTKGNRFSLYFVATTEPGYYLENPRQISAYRYPQQYGPCSPSFARATLFSHDDVNKLILSGTASIVGHETLHVGNPEKQLEETLRNIDGLLRHESVLEHQKQPAQFSSIKVYVRHPGDLPRIQSRVSEYFGSHAPVLYLHSDICRSDLLLEIEGICDL